MKNKILIGVGIVIGLVVLGGIFSSSNPQVAGTQIEAVPNPTNTPTPTITPTPTPNPTAKPVVSPTPKVKPPVIDAGCGTYINSFGQEVARPCPANNVPAGATAKCRDGTYSYSQSRRGTCSHHGGVAQWL